MGHIAGKETANDMVHLLEEHAHSRQKTYPTGAPSITLTSSGVAWTHGAIVEIVPAGVIPDDFDVHWLLISGLSANGEYEVKLYKGAPGSEEEISEVAAIRNAVQSQEGSKPVLTKLIEKGTRISASLASSNAAANTCAVKVFYHEY